MNEFILYLNVTGRMVIRMLNLMPILIQKRFEKRVIKYVNKKLSEMK